MIVFIDRKNAFLNSVVIIFVKKIIKEASSLQFYDHPLIFSNQGDIDQQVVFLDFF
jgi:hypothetical protein